MTRFILFSSILTALGMVRFYAAPDDKGGTPGLGKIQDPKNDDERHAQMRRQAAAAAQTLQEKAARAAQTASRAAGRAVAPEPTKTADELYQEMLDAEGGDHSQEPGATTGPNPGTQPLRPGETTSGPATGELARQSLYPEHQARGISHTINAPGLGADSGVKKTADNPDARAPGTNDHAQGVDPADPVAQAPGVATERHDTLKNQADRQAAEALIEAALAKGELPDRSLFLELGVPEEHIEATLEQAKREIEARKQAQEAGNGQAQAPGTVPPPVDGEKQPVVGGAATANSEGAGAGAQ